MLNRVSAIRMYNTIYNAYYYYRTIEFFFTITIQYHANKYEILPINPVDGIFHGAECCAIEIQ